jgi:hypothetical protein
LAPHGVDVVETSKRNPIVKPEKKYLKHLQSEESDLDLAGCWEDLLRHFGVQSDKWCSPYLATARAVNPRSLECHRLVPEFGYGRVADKPDRIYTPTPYIYLL